MPTFTGSGVEVYRLTVAKSAVRLEAVGLRVRRGRKVTPQIAVELGLGPRAKPAVVLEAIEKRLTFLVRIAQAEGGITP